MALLAIAMKVLVPGGYMLDASPRDGALTLVLCTAEGLVTIPVADQAPAGHNDKDPAEPQHDPCVFAGHGVYAPAVATSDPVPTPWRPLGALVSTAAYAVAPGRGLAAPPPPATGPPASLI